MEVKVVAGDIAQLKVDAIVVNLFEGVTAPGGATGAVDRALGGAISQLIAQGEMKGKLHENTLIHTLRRLPADRVLVAGLGKSQDFNLDRVGVVSAEACRALRRVGVKKMATIVHGAGIGGLEAEPAAKVLVEGSLLGLYRFRKYLTKEEDAREIEELQIVEQDQGKVPALERGTAKGEIVAEAVNFARDLVNEPSNTMTPSGLAEAAQAVGKAHGLEVEVLERDKMEELGMGALLGVARGSSQPPKFIVMYYRGDPSSKKVLGYVGKALTFDSGGISIKPSEGMEEMKTDMAGGAAVIAAMGALAHLKPKVNVTGLIPATENMPGGNAQKPGDIVRTMSGKTIEVINTDAEGRLILADAMAYARKLGLTHLVDMATLTGACIIALGKVCTGAFGNNQEWMSQVLKAAEEVGEKTWQMPMYEEYKEQYKSEVADLKNVGGRPAGAITGAQIIGEFVEDTPWVHLDIAGTAFTDKEQGYLVKGATGAPVRTLIALALNQADG